MKARPSKLMFQYLIGCDWLRDIGAVATEETTTDCILFFQVIQKFETWNVLLSFVVSFKLHTYPQLKIILITQKMALEEMENDGVLNKTAGHWEKTIGWRAMLFCTS